ncbi:MAG TPA: ABC transporter permease [Chthoniobacteraceae bacterium]|nr:ABC transporter permease [Chthoniobacteraceae bacterium]
MNALLRHLLLTLRLNLRSRQAMVYGYLVPIFFLLAFGSVFRSSVPPLVREMGQLITITILGGACFGMPTTMVNERERGVWRRYRLLPTATAGLILSAMVARYIIVLLGVLLQIALAWCIYRTPMPAHPAQLLIAFTFVCFSFLGLGLIIAMVADSVPAVQALGQAVFLPMIMIGGVGVPLSTLPVWAQNVAGFLPGRYAVEALQTCIQPGRNGLAEGRFALLALTVIGLAACLAGAKMFRWDTGQKMSGASKAWVLVALAAWTGVGCAAWRTDRLTPRPGIDLLAAPAQWQRITDAEINAITYDDLADYPDDGDMGPFAPNFNDLDDDSKKRLDAIQAKLANWAPGNDPVIDQRVRNLLSVCSDTDIAQDRLESVMPIIVFDQLKKTISADELKQAVAWVVLHPDEGKVITAIPELDIDGTFEESIIRERNKVYGKKFLLRLLNKQAPAPK